MALALTGVMLCSPISVFAADTTESPASGNATGDGKVEGIVNKDIFTVELPTIAEDDKTFNFILDPQGLIKDTSAGAYESAKFEDGASLFFKLAKADAAGNAYASSSDALTVTNKGSVAVDVSLTATASNLSNDADTIALTSDNTFADDTSASVYLALVSGDTTKALTSDAGATIQSSMDAVDEKNFEVKYDSTNGYTYGLKADTQDSEFKTLSFNLTGVCNTSADTATWDKVKDITPSVEVTWTLAKHTDKPEFTTGSALGTITYVKGSGDDALASIKSITMTNTKGTFNGYAAYTNAWSAATDNGGTITFDSRFIAYYNANPTTLATVTYVTVGGETKTATVSVKTAE